MNSTHSLYDQFAESWQRVRDVLAGEDAVKGGGIRYVPRLVLDAEGAVEKSRVDEFRNNNVTLKKQLDELLKKYEGVDPDEARKLLEHRRDVP